MTDATLNEVRDLLDRIIYCDPRDAAENPGTARRILVLLAEAAGAPPSTNSAAPDLSLLSDVRSLLRCIRFLFGSLPPVFRAAHIEGRITALLARLDRAIPKGGE